MDRLKYTLISDGPTDANLIPIINWTLKEIAGLILAEGTHAELSRLPVRPVSLEDRICKAIEYFPCQALFIHRDTEKGSPDQRSSEIRHAYDKAQTSVINLPVVTIIPVRMLEAWLLFSEKAIRYAAGNPHGTVQLDLPALRQLEHLPDPKQALLHTLVMASELRGRRRKKFNCQKAFWRLVDFLDDFTPLRQLSAYVAFENTVRRIVNRQWQPGFYGIEPCSS